MDMLDGLLSRRSIRKYEDKEVPKDVLEKILEAAMYSPTAMNKQAWEFIVTDDRKKFEGVLEEHGSAKMLLGANKAIVVCCNMDKVHDGYMEIDCGAVTQNILLAAHGLGLGACWIGIHPRENRVAKLRELYELPDHIQPFAMVSLGYPAEEHAMPERFDEAKIRWDI